MRFAGAASAWNATAATLRTSESTKFLTCFISERLMVRETLARRSQLMRELHQLQRDRHAEPVSAPAPRGPHPNRITVG